MRLTLLAAVRVAALAVSLGLTCVSAAAQERPRAFAGGLFGVSTLSADAQSETRESEAAFSSYKPENGPAINLFAGLHLFDYFSVQANWLSNRNDLTLSSSFVTAAGGGFYEQQRHSRQNAFVLDGLIYFRRLDSAVRPYLGTGLAVVRFSSDVAGTSIRGLTPPAGEIESTRVGLRSHVGIDLRLSRHIDFRYSFSETLTANPISRTLTPPAPRRLANFQNLFGFVARF